MKVIGFVGSPRKGGNTDILIDKLLEGAKSKGAETEKIYISDLNINYCVGDLGCIRPDKHPGKCIHKDDMANILEKMVKSDVLVFGTPKYMRTITPQMLNFLSRMCPLIEGFITKDESGQLQLVSEEGREWNTKIAGKKVVIVAVQGWPSPGTPPYFSADLMIDVMKANIGDFKLELAGCLHALDVNFEGDVLKKTEYLEKAYNLGLSVVG